MPNGWKLERTCCWQRDTWQPREPDLRISSSSKRAGGEEKCGGFKVIRTLDVKLWSRLFCLFFSLSSCHCQMIVFDKRDPLLHSKDRKKIVWRGLTGMPSISQVSFSLGWVFFLVLSHIIQFQFQVRSRIIQFQKHLILDSCGADGH